MKMPFSVVFIVLTLSSLIQINAKNTIFNVIDYGAVGDAQTDDANAFEKAWQATCGSDASSPTMIVPSGKTFFTTPMQFQGPCKSKAVNVQIDGNLVAPSEPSDWKCGNGNCKGWINFHWVNGLSVRGHAVIDAKGAKWWGEDSRPNTFQIAQSNNVFLGGGLTFKDSPRVHVNLFDLQSLFVSNLTIVSPENSPNTDGIHLATCTNSIVDGAHIGTGDDCISVIGESSYLTIRNIVCGPGHGISIGSLGRDGDEAKVEHITVSDVVFIGASNGVRIKTWQGGRGYARNFLFQRILSHHTKFPITIDQNYCDKHRKCEAHSSAVQISNVTYSQVLGTSKGKIAVSLICSEAMPCRDIFLNDIYLVSRDGKGTTYDCKNVKGNARGRMFLQMSCLN